MPKHTPPPRFHVLAKPSGATCNLACSYCFFLDKELLYPNSKFRMTEETLEAYIQQLITVHRSNQVGIKKEGEKTYSGIITLGKKTPSMDLETEVIEEKPVREIKNEEIEKVPDPLYRANVRE